VGKKQQADWGRCNGPRGRRRRVVRRRVVRRRRKN
jgi:hypothetical protein